MIYTGDIRRQDLWCLWKTSCFPSSQMALSRITGCEMNAPHIPSLKLTQHLEMDGWNTKVSFKKWPIFRCELLVSGG